MMSPARTLGWTARTPSCMDHPFEGKSEPRALCQPLPDLPSHNNRQPCAFSCGSRLLGIRLRMKMPIGGAGFRFFFSNEKFFHLVGRPALFGFSLEYTS